MRKYVDSMVGRGRHWLRQPIEELGRWEGWVRYGADLVGHCYRQAMRDRLPQMAAALTYRTLFGLIPFAVVSVIVFKAFGGFSGAGPELVDNIFAQLHISDLSITMPAEQGGEPQTLSADQLLARITTQMDEIQFGSIGVVGLVVLAWGAIVLVVTVEGCFNTIFNAPTGRPWYLRVPIYWAMITLGPVLLVASFYLTSQVITQTETLPWLGQVVSSLSQFTAVGANWVLLMIMFTLLPNTVVRFRTAAVGALVTAIVFEIGKVGFGYYLDRAVTNSIYGTIGVVPLFLLWLYITWMLILLGLELSYALQTLPRGRLEQQQMLRDDELTLDPRWLIPLTATIALAFEQGDRLTTEEIAQRLQLPPRQVRRAAEHLYSHRILYRIETETESDPGYTLAMPPYQIKLARLLSLGQTISARLTEGQYLPGASLLTHLLETQQRELEKMTLADVIHNEGREVNEPVS